MMPLTPLSIPRLAATCALVLVAATGCGLFGEDGPSSGQEAAAAIDGVVNYHVENPDLLIPEHVEGRVFYEVRPPVGGKHNPTWQDCNGKAYPAPVLDEHAVHSLEHGAVWITYRPDLPADAVEALAERVRDTEKLFLSPYPGLDAPVSVQAWGYQLKVDDPADDRIDEFIRVLRVNAGLEPNVPCAGGTDATT